MTTTAVTATTTAVTPAYLVVALQVEFETQILKPVFYLIGFRLWV
jgi:hypothetical protein